MPVGLDGNILFYNKPGSVFYKGNFSIPQLFMSNQDKDS